MVELCDVVCVGVCFGLEAEIGEVGEGLKEDTEVVRHLGLEVVRH